MPSSANKIRLCCTRSWVVAIDLATTHQLINEMWWAWHVSPVQSPDKF
jgi:hypothetical protein